MQEELEPDLQMRDREITEIAKSIASLAELFKDLSTLVIDQGTLLDSVEYNIEQTSVHMAEAVTELKIAEGCVPLGSLILICHALIYPLSGRAGTYPWVFWLGRCDSTGCILQVPEEHGAPKMHFLAAADHLRTYCGADLQAEETQSRACHGAVADAVYRREWEMDGCTHGDCH